MLLDFNCPACEELINIDSSKIGTTIECEHCGASINLVDDGLLAAEQEINEFCEQFNGSSFNLIV